jgi:hypothetical protein
MKIAAARIAIAGGLVVLAAAAQAAQTKDPPLIAPAPKQPAIACDAYLSACKRHNRPDARHICQAMRKLCGKKDDR